MACHVLWKSTRHVKAEARGQTSDRNVGSPNLSPASVRHLETVYHLDGSDVKGEKQEYWKSQEPNKIQAFIFKKK